MNKPRVKGNSESILLTTEQVCELANLGATTVRKIASESGAARKIGRSFRIHKEIFFDYIERSHS